MAGLIGLANQSIIDPQLLKSWRLQAITFGKPSVFKELRTLCLSIDPR